jgi:hypothetical protein
MKLLGKYFLFLKEAGAKLLRLIYPAYEGIMIHPAGTWGTIYLTQLNIPDYLTTTARTSKLSRLQKFTYLFASSFI